MRPRRNVPVVSTTAPVRRLRPSASVTAGHAAIGNDEIVGFGLDDRQVRSRANRLLHRSRVELAVSLGARAAHRRALAAIEHPELNAAAVGHPAHQPVERIDLADQMALAEPADRRVARHRADGREAVGDERGSRAHARGRGRSLAARVPAADDDDIEAHPCELRMARFT